MVFVLIASALAQIRYLNRALQRFDSTQVIPTQFVLFTFSVIVGSAVLYRDFNSATPDRVGKFLGGCALTFLGVYLITSGRPRSNRLEDGELEDEEEAIGLVDEERYQDESGFVDGEDDDGRRKPRASNSFDRDQSSKKSRQSSGQHRNGHSPLPQTPQRLHSYSSSTKSNTSTKDGEEPESPLGNNPWRSPEDISDPTTRPTPKENTVSSPMLPSEAQRSGIPPTRSQSRRHLSPHKSDRPSTLSRKSMSRMLPGPLVSPLSSPLNAIVADSLRRGVDPRRRPGISSLRQSRSQRSTIDSGSGEMTFETSQLSNVHEAGGGGPGASSSLDKGRSQSMGATLADLFRIKKDRSQGMKSTETEENSGSSPSY